MGSLTPAGLLLISGPTGSGKSRVAASLAENIDGEIVNGDSIQIYRGFDIGSAKPSPEIRRSIPHHLYDRLDPDEHLDVAGWVALAEDAIESIRGRKNIPIVVGGTNFYLRSLLRGLPELPSRQPELRRRLDSILRRSGGARHLHRLLRSIDPASGERISPSDRHRIERAIEVFAASGKPISAFERPSPEKPPRYRHAQYALHVDRPELRRRLDERVENMYEAGLVEEVRDLLDRYSADLRPFGSIGYREVVDHLRGVVTLEAAIETTKRRTWAYARRQMTWLRAERDVQWVDATKSTESIVDFITDSYERSMNEESAETNR
ncbi:MAG: tRNA (adenosine(37)-N6)-dimethylallyltransferase MiaA [Thermoanaerobaculia bacterium]|nr:tRNA (adenosine(37)-N6)-dimethylallyltransferase MiaA [Thermoanaerobaculia bacterium]